MERERVRISIVRGPRPIIVSDYFIQLLESMLEAPIVVGSERDKLPRWVLDLADDFVVVVDNVIMLDCLVTDDAFVSARTGCWIERRKEN